MFMINRLVPLIAVVVLWAGSLRAEVWCGQGPLTPLDHPCPPAPEGALSRAVTERRNMWTALDGVSSVESKKSESGNEVIWVRVGPNFAKSSMSQISPSAEGVPVVILPSSTQVGEFAVGVLSSGSGSHPADATSLRSSLATRANSKEVYSEVIHNYGKSWLGLPGVIEIGPARCADDSCDFGSVGITVQRQLLSLARMKIPGSVDGVPIVLISQE
jgi:hypothetical protein